MSRLFCFGLGYSAGVLAARLKAEGWQIAGTVRDADKAARLAKQGYEVRVFAQPGDAAAVLPSLERTTHLLLSVPPAAKGDPVLAAFGDALAGLGTLAWIGYLSTVGVYGDHAGATVDEGAALNAISERGRARIAAEQAWLAFGARIGVPAQVFRLAGIYGPGRSVLDKLREGTAHRIVKPGQVFSRIHVEDIATVLQASMARPHQGAIYNVADDEPAPPQDVVAYGAELLGIAPPAEVPFDKAALSPMARSFYADRRRIANRLIRCELGVRLAYPNYRDGLKALL